MLQKSEKIKAILFDMDGVLIDAREWHYEALNKALALFGYSISRYDHLVTFDGLPTSRKLQMLSLERGLPESLHSFINELKQSFTIEACYSHCKPKFIHQYLLSQLKARGYRLGCCSNSIRRTIETMLTQSQLISFFETIVSNEEVRHPKPNPEMYLKAQKLLGLKAEECLIVEDNEHGIKAAKESGAHVMKVSSVEDVNYQSILARINQINGGVE